MKRSMQWRMVLSFLVLILFMAACGGGGEDPAATGDGQSSVAYNVVALVADSACPNGGIQVESGIDQNRNGMLDPAEVTSTQSVCNGETGASGSNALIVVTAEPAGTNCSNGGSHFQVGADTNGNARLDAEEVTSADYVCNGLSGGGFSWVEVTGTYQQASVNTGYLANSAQEVTIMLPAAPALGDTVRVSGVGAGGWKIGLNPGQSIVTRDLPETPSGSTWGTLAAASKIWSAVASSADGSKLVAAELDGRIYTSTDSGATWTPREANRGWRGVASSADGTKLVAVDGGTTPDYLGEIYTSGDAGVTWTPRGYSGHWAAVASSADGSKLVAAEQGEGGAIYTSTDAGVSWIARGPYSDYYLPAVASSADGTRLVSVTAGRIYLSSDSGVNWITRTVSHTFNAVASSADGSKLVAASGDDPGTIYTSTDFGTTWTATPLSSPTALSVWIGIATPADASRVLAVAMNFDAYSNALVGSPIFTATLPDPSLPVLPNLIHGGQYAALELQYVGNNTFIMLSMAGDLVLRP